MGFGDYMLCFLWLKSLFYDFKKRALILRDNGV
jgi:hypothetical protein